MIIPTEPIGSIPRPLSLIELVRSTGSTDPKLDSIYDEAVRDTIERFEETGSPVVSDGEQQHIGAHTCPGGDCDDTSTTRDTAFAKIRVRVLGTALAAKSIAGD